MPSAHTNCSVSSYHNEFTNCSHLNLCLPLDVLFESSKLIKHKPRSDKKNFSIKSLCDYFSALHKNHQKYIFFRFWLISRLAQRFSKTFRLELKSHGASSDDIRFHLSEFLSLLRLASLALSDRYTNISFFRMFSPKPSSSLRKRRKERALLWIFFLWFNAIHMCVRRWSSSTVYLMCGRKGFMVFARLYLPRETRNMLETQSEFKKPRAASRTITFHRSRFV